VLHIATWWWGNKYDVSYVNKLLRGLHRNMRTPFRFLCVTDKREIYPFQTVLIKEQDHDLLKIDGCFARLRMFDPQWQKENDIWLADHIVCIDLDVIITDRIDPLFARMEPFVILQGANSVNPCPYNGSLWMLRGGAFPEVWRDFNLNAAREAPYHEFPDDQGWLWHKLPQSPGWQVGPASGIYAFRKQSWPRQDGLPQMARLVCFPGARDPKQFQFLPWIATHWR